MNSLPSTSYKVTLIAAADEDFAELDGSIKKLAYQQFAKLSRSPELGEPCGNKYGLNLTGFRSLHFAKNAFRIVYRIIEKRVQIWGIGERKEEGIYRMVAARLYDVQIQIVQSQSIKVSGKARRRPKP
jgi:mRNA interferase RelE/StbE